MLDYRLQLRCRHGTSIPESLNRRASDCFDVFHLHFIFYTLCNNMHIQLFGHGNNGCNNLNFYLLLF